MYPDGKDEVVQLHLDDIIPNRFQPREVFDEKALKELAVSIKEHGVIQPIIVRSVGGKYEIIAGERRYKASALAGLTKIPAIVRDLDDKESSKVALLENLQRKNLNPIEEARTYQKILEIDEMTQEELAKNMGKSQSAVANKIRLLSLSEEVQEALLREEISERHARALLNVDDKKQQKELLKKVIDNKMTVRLLEQEIKGEEEKIEEPKVEEKENVEEIPSQSSFMSSDPLIPTTEIEKEDEEYGKVTIAPAEGDEPRFINYGEIDKKEEDTNLPIDNESQINLVDINEIKENAIDIEKNDSGADLDNLLNIPSATNPIENKEFITPAEEIVKTDLVLDEDENSDYFKTPDFSEINIDHGILDTVTKEENQNSIEDNISLEEAKQKIITLVNELQAKGINISFDEMDFEKSYQLIVKIDKTNK